MSYAIIDYNETKWPYSIKTTYSLGKMNILLPHFKIKKSEKYAKKVASVLDENKIENIVINKDILNNRLFCENLVDKKKHIITGRKMYRVILLRALKDISYQMKYTLPKQKLALLVDDYCIENVDLIKSVAKEVKSLTVVTTDKEKFDMISQELFKNYGIIIKVVEKNTTNLNSANTIVNVDFPCYDMNKINIDKSCLIICGFAIHYDIPKNFDGIVIRKIEVIDAENTNHNIDDLSLCEAKIYSYLRKLKENDRIFEREGYRINGYFGENGKLTSEDFKNLGKKLLDK